MPSGLPLFSHILDAANAGLVPLLRYRLDYLAPEPLFRSLMLAGVDMEELLTEVFSSAGAKPNAVHFVLAHLLLTTDAKVWTTNYDTLIEDAIDHLAEKRGKLIVAPVNLMKPHGTFKQVDTGRWAGSERLVFNADQVVIDWPQSRRDQLYKDCENASLVLLGYSGLDVNSYSALRAAIRVASTVDWLVLEGSGPASAKTREAILFRFPELTDKQLIGSGNPSADFVGKFGRGLDFATETTLEKGEESVPVMGPMADLTAITRRVSQFATQGIVARELGERSVARSLFKDALSAGKSAIWPRVQMLRHIPWVQRVRSRSRDFLGHLPASAPLTDSLRSRMVADRTYRDVPQALAMAARIEEWIPRTRNPVDRSRLLLAMSAALRFAGRFEEAVQQAREALDIARDPSDPSPTEAARAEFELVESLRTLGAFEEAFEYLRMRLHTLGMSHWGAWLDYETSCIFLQLRDEGRAEEHLKLADRFFYSIDRDHPETTFDPTFGQNYVRLSWVALHRLRMELDEAQRQLDLHDQQAGPRHPSVVLWIRSFQQAEILRGRGEWEAARKLYRKLTQGIETSEGFGLLGLALCAWGEGHTSPLFQRSVDSFAEVGTVFGLAYCYRFASESGSPIQLGNQLESRVRSVHDLIWKKPSPAHPSDQIAWI
jgi:tetratricopeptide (TPR) repeat protein